MSEHHPLVVKIGGGLLRERGLDGLRRACADASGLAASRPVLVVPGGGPFADAVRAVDAAAGLPDDIAHALALRAMDQLGVLLRRLLPAAGALDRLVAPRGLAVLLAAPAFHGRPEVPESWAVTSDSLAVLAAAAIGAEAAVLLKPVSGVLEPWPADDPTGGSDGSDPVPALTAAELQALQDRGGGRAVDAYLPTAVRHTRVTVIVREPVPARPAHRAGSVGTRISPR